MTRRVSIVVMRMLAMAAPALMPRVNGTRALESAGGGEGMGERSWVKGIGKQLREDMGDCPTLPEEMLDLLRKLDSLEGQRTAGRENTVEHNFGVRRPRGFSARDADDH